MRILVADKLPESHLERLRVAGHEVLFRPELGTDDLASALDGVEVLVVRSTRVTAPVIESAHDLALVVRAGAGVNTIDVEAAADRGVVVANTPGKNSIAVAELTMGLILAIDRNIPDNVIDLRRGEWNKQRWSRTTGLAGRRLGIIGFGSIGQEVAVRAKSFAMDVVLVDRAGRGAEAQRVVDDIDPILVDSIEQLAAASDIVTVHVPSTPDTRGLIDRELLAALRPGAVVINTSRGDVVDEAAALEAIDEKDLRFGVDVFADEPSSGTGEVSSTFAQHPRVYATHHIGASTEQAQTAVADEVVELITAFGRGAIPNAVNVMIEPVGAAVVTVRHADRVGVLASVLEVLRRAHLNVEQMENRIFVGARAASATIHVGGVPDRKVIDELEALPDVMAVRVGAIGGSKPLVRPLDAYLPRPDLAASIVAPAVSSITVDRFEALVSGNESSILHVLRGAIDSRGGGASTDADEKGAERLTQMIAGGLLEPTGRAAFYVYRVGSERRTHTSLIGDLALSGLETGAVRPHEDTRKETEDLVLRHLEIVRAHTDPVAVTHRADARLADILDELVTATEPHLDFTSHDGSRQQLWPVTDPELVAAIAARLAATGPMYVTDGHHRIAAAARLDAAQRGTDPGPEPRSSEYIPAVFVADDQTDLFGYHRGVVDLAEHDPRTFLAALRQDLVVEELAVNWHDEARPRQAGVVGMYLADRWYRLAFPKQLVPADPYESLDAVMLQEYVLGPHLAITEPRSDLRLRYVPGPAGLGALAAGDYAVGFALHPPTVADVMRIADMRRSMPPKSTWFEPKVKAGLVVRTLS